MLLVRSAAVRRYYRVPTLPRSCSYASEALTPAVKPATFGQPIFQSHPHLVKSDELTPGITSAEYESRRRKLMESLPSNSLVVLTAGRIKYMSGQIFYKFRQASDFWYLTGFEEPDAAVVLEKNSSSRGYRMTLFSSGSDPHKEKWDGPKTTFENARNHFNADDSLPFTALPGTLRSLLPSFTHIYVDIINPSSRRSSPKTILKYLSPSAPPKSEYDGIIEALNSKKRKDLTPEIAKLRVIKSPAEQRIMKSAADISGSAFSKTMRFTRPGISEHELAAHFEYLCSLSGSQRPAYVPVVASGANSLIIHYTSNNQLIREDEIVLIDAGCEYNGYATDITRTYPASGIYTPAQRDLYTAVLNAQKSLIRLCTEKSGYSLMDLHRKSVDLLTEELKQIWGGSSLTKSLVERELYPHYVGHPIGIDLHESNQIDREERLREGMVITVEPGLYVPPSPAFPTAFHNIGIRIEDVVLVGSEHPRVLSVNAPKEISDVEGACQGLLGLDAS